MMKRKPALYILIGLLAGGAITALVWFKPLSLAAPPSPSPTTPSSQGVPARWGMMGQPDQHFIVMMIPHHEGAVSMADLALTKAQHPEIKRLAQAIKTTQTQEIEEMRTWYKQWYGTEVPAWGPGNRWGWYNRNPGQPGQNQMPMGGSGMGMYRNWNQQRQPGMMGGMMGARWMGTDLYALQNASDFDRAFIQQMIPHHQMAVMMASMVLNNSQRPEIRNLAQSIITSQTNEINQMQQWYQQWYQ